MRSKIALCLPLRPAGFARPAGGVAPGAGGGSAGKDACLLGTAARGRLRVILEKGRACKRELENLTNEADELVNQTDVLTGEMSEMAGNVKQAETEWEEARSGSPNLEAQPGYAPAKEQLDQIEREIEAFGTDTRRQELLDRKAQWQRPVPSRGPY